MTEENGVKDPNIHIVNFTLHEQVEKLEQQTADLDQRISKLEEALLDLGKSQAVIVDFATGVQGQIQNIMKIVELLQKRVGKVSKPGLIVK